jgi:hypothetical protein
LYKLGVFPVNSGLIKKEFKVTNNGPKPVEVNWKIYPSQIKFHKNMIRLSIVDQSPGSADAIKLNWDPIEPEEEKDSLFSIEPRYDYE